MKQKIGLILSLIIYFVLWTVAVWFTGEKISENIGQKRVVFMNRMSNQIQLTGDTDVSKIAADFKRSDVATNVSVFYLDEEKSSSNDGFFNRSYSNKNTYIWKMDDENGELAGFIKFEFDNTVINSLLKGS